MSQLARRGRQRRRWLAGDSGARVELQKALHRRDAYEGGTGSEHVIMILRAIIESEGNGLDALNEHTVRAVGSVIRPGWTSKGLAFIEACVKSSKAKPNRSCLSASFRVGKGRGWRVSWSCACSTWFE